MRKLITTAALAAGLLVVSQGSANAQAARHYDCSKPGNANKTACKGAATAPAPAAPTRTATARHYDCSKPGNANKAVCKANGAATPSAAQVTASRSAAPAAKPSIFSRLTHRATTSSASAAAPVGTSGAGPNGATAQCRDGTYSHSAHRSGTCSRHGGVKTWF